MKKENPFDRISINPNVCFGKPCIKGTRIWVSHILSLLAGGESVETVLQEYPQISKEDVLACMAYGAAMTDFREVQVG